MISSLIEYLERSWLNIYFIPLVLGVTVAFFDNIGRRMFLQVVNNGEVYQAMEALYMQLFHGFVFLSVGLTTGVVFYYRRDVRDALAYLVYSLAVVYSGLWDILYYWIQGMSVPSELEHLADTPVGSMATLFNNGVVSREMLFLNMVVFLVGGLALAGFIRFYEFDL